MSTTHDWARDLQKTAEFLLSRKEVEIGNLPATRKHFLDNKEAFLECVRMAKPGKKDLSSTYFVDFTADGANVEFAIERDKVCRRVNPEYECDPWLTEEDNAELEASK